MQRIYLDSNIFIAFIKSELGKGFKLMAQDVEDFFRKCPKNYVLILSEWFFKEVEKNGYYSKQEVLELLSKKKIQYEIIDATEIDLINAKNNFKDIHTTDALHLVLALKSKCSIFLTFNIKDFKSAKEVIEIKEPSNLD
ncbi:MAG: hypothetical protein AABW72_01225 [archaeon]